jgi:hypothetical protein
VVYLVSVWLLGSHVDLVLRAAVVRGLRVAGCLFGFEEHWSFCVEWLRCLFVQRKCSGGLNALCRYQSRPLACDRQEDGQRPAVPA